MIKKSLVFILILSSFLMCTLSSAASVDSGTIPSAALTYFEGMIDKLQTGEHYFIYKSGDNVAVMLHSHSLKLTNGMVSGTNVNQIVYNSRGQNNGTNQYSPTIDFSILDSIQIDTDRTSIVYSSLGSWATLGDQKQFDLLTFILWTVIIILFVIIIFKFFRYRKGYISL